jgi:hypothetical protein
MFGIRAAVKLVGLAAKCNKNACYSIMIMSMVDV